MIGPARTPVDGVRISALLAIFAIASLSACTATGSAREYAASAPTMVVPRAAVVDVGRDGPGVDDGIPFFAYTSPLRPAAARSGYVADLVAAGYHTTGERDGWVSFERGRERVRVSIGRSGPPTSILVQVVTDVAPSTASASAASDPPMTTSVLGEPDPPHGPNVPATSTGSGGGIGAGGNGGSGGGGATVGGGATGGGGGDGTSTTGSGGGSAGADPGGGDGTANGNGNGNGPGGNADGGGNGGAGNPGGGPGNGNGNGPGGNSGGGNPGGGNPGGDHPAGGGNGNGNGNGGGAGNGDSAQPSPTPRTPKSPKPTKEPTPHDSPTETPRGQGKPGG